MKKRNLSLALTLCLLVALFVAGCGTKEKGTEKTGKNLSDSTLIYGSNNYTRINPAIDEHGEINLLIFSGLTGHDADNKIVPGLAEKWELDDATNTYTFHLREGVKWHDGKEFTSEDVKFTIDAIKNPDNESEIASNYEDVKSIEVIDKYTISFVLKEKNVAFTEYMTIGILPKHMLEGENMQTSDFFKHPIGTGPYKIKKWDKGQSITLVKNKEYFNGEPKINTIIFKIVEDVNAKALQLKSGEIDLAQITPKDAQTFEKDKSVQIFEMTTADYRGIMYNFNNEFWKKHSAIIPALNYAFDRQVMVDSVLLGQGVPAYGPLQRNSYNNENVEKYDYNPKKAKELIQADGWKMGADGIYEKNKEKLSFEIVCMEGDQVRIDLASIASQQLKEIGVDAKVKVDADIDWAGLDTFLIGWGSPFDADDHTYKVFGTDKGSNYNGYSDELVDKYLSEARQTDDTSARKEAYAKFQEEIAKQPAYSFFCYCDVDYVANKNLQGISKKTVLGHHGVGIFWNVSEWTFQK